MSIFGYSLFQGLNKLLWPQQVNWTFQLITPQLLLFKHVFAKAQKTQDSSLVITVIKNADIPCTRQATRVWRIGRSLLTASSGQIKLTMRTVDKKYPRWNIFLGLCFLCAETRLQLECWSALIEQIFGCALFVFFC